jgi:Na+/glutamate symporter
LLQSKIKFIKKKKKKKKKQDKKKKKKKKKKKNLKNFITYEVLLDRTCMRCPIFFTAANYVQALFQARCGGSLAKAH